MESADSSTSSGGAGPHLPPGFRFHPTDEELVVHYLKKKAVSAPLPVAIIAEIDLYKFDPWELPAKASFGEEEYYFFTSRDRKYPNGSRPNRAATSGYWKATGTDKPVVTACGTQKVGVKKALVFYRGKPPRGIKTNWIMHEYRLFDSTKPPGYDPAATRRGSLRLDDWVLCRIYKRSSVKPVDYERDQDFSMLAHQQPQLTRSYGAASPSLMMEAAGLQFDGSMLTQTDAALKRNLQPSPLPLYWTAQDESAVSGTAKAGQGSSSASISGLLSQLQQPGGTSHSPFNLAGLNSWYP